MTSSDNIAVVLFQLGGPDSMEAVEPFLYNLFCDPDIIDFPGAFLARKWLARFISHKRAPIAGAHYEQIGGKSPIKELTSAQARAVSDKLSSHYKVTVFTAMRYWHPLTETVVAEMKQQQFDKIILLPLYPHYSKTTTGSSLNEWRRQCAKQGYHPVNQETIESFYNHPLYIRSIVERVDSAYAKFSHLDPAEVELVFSAHGVPVSVIKSGDPYQEQIEKTVQYVTQEGKWQSPHRLCYQSKVGPMQWLKPSLDETIQGLAESGRKHLLIIPIAFVTDHIETLHEINIEARERALHLGIKQFEMMPALNDSPTFIDCLTRLVLEKI